MTKIEKVSWGKVKIGGREYHQVLLVGNKVISRDVERLENLFGTTHKIGKWEQEKLLSNKPEVILVANGWSGILRVGGDFKKKIKKAGVELRVVLTPRVVGEYKRLTKEGRRVNVLIHTTC